MNVTCCKCKKLVKTVYHDVPRAGPTCAKCFDEGLESLETVPRIRMDLSKFKGAEKENLYNSTLGHYERRMGVSDFERCGWFVRKVEERADHSHYLLEFFGNSICAKFPDFDYPSGFKPCEKAGECKSQEANAIL
jgi:hypothetical protein